MAARPAPSAPVAVGVGVRHTPSCLHHGRLARSPIYALRIATGLLMASLSARLAGPSRPSTSAAVQPLGCFRGCSAASLPLSVRG
jgi:hypothetical protein